MPVAQAASKLPPGEFRVYTSHDHPIAITKKAMDGGEQERRRFSTVISSTIRDMGGDEMKMTALEDMRDAFRGGIPMFMNHDYKVPDSSFGMSDYAEIKDSGTVDDTGNTVWDLHISGFVDEYNPVAVQLSNSIAGGMKFGASVGAIVTKHKTNEVGGKDIFNVNLKEGSIVGLPMNQRSLGRDSDRHSQTG
jgi:hypothetical protein